MAEEAAPRDIQMSSFTTADDPDETGRKWGKWKKELATRLRFFKITEAQDKIDALNIYGGELIRELIETLPDGAAAGNEYDMAVGKLDTFFTPMVNADSARSKFERLHQLDRETVAQYNVRLRMQAVKCNFPDTNDTIRSKLLQSMRDGKLRREAMVKRYSLVELLDHAASREDIDRQAKEIEAPQFDQAHKIFTKKKYTPGPTPSKMPGRRENNKADNNKGDITCKFCGRKHKITTRTDCPAWGKTCNACKKTNHFAVVCRQKEKGNSRDKTHSVEENPQSDESAFHIHTIQDNEKDARPTVKVTIDGVKGSVDADSCSTVNIMDKGKFNLIRSHMKQPVELKPSNAKVFSYGSKKPLALAGYFEAEIVSRTTHKSKFASFLVTEEDTGTRPLISLKTCIDLGILDIANSMNEDSNYVFQEYPDVFTGLGKHKYIKAKLLIDETEIPIAHKQRRIPFHLQKQAEEEENRLEDMDIIEKVPDHTPTTWCVNPVVAPKLHDPNKIRYCSDMRVPNKAIRRPITEALSVEDIRVKLKDAKIFSVLDMNEGYHQIELEEESRHVTTFHGSNTRMRYKRLNYGTSSAQDIFDRAMDDTIRGLTGVLHIRDDFVVFGKKNEDHDEALKKLIERFRECGLTFNKKKCKLRLPAIEFFGFVFTEKGMSPAPSKVAALKNTEPPKDATEVRSLLGMAQYSANFIPKFAEMTTPLRLLTHQKSKWKWGKEENEAFMKLKNALTEHQILAYFDTKKETKLHVDAGPNGLGLILLQKDQQDRWEPIMCASRSLTETEKRYSQIEKEALAIRWGCEKCYKYLIGSRFVLETDHKPLVPMLSNRHSHLPMRIEKWMLYLQQFEFEIVHIAGKLNGADYLSRYALKASERDVKHSSAREAVVRAIIEKYKPRSISLEEIREETKTDPATSVLITAVKTGDQEKCKLNSLREFKGIFHELSEIDGILLRGNHIVIPTSLRNRIVKLAHDGHMGIVKTKTLLRSKVWFPGMDKLAEHEVRACILCQASTPQNFREPLQMTPLPEKPWELVSADFCGPFPSGEYALVVIDAYSRYPEVEVVKSTAASSSIPAFEKIFATHGIVREIRTDNGPPFNGQEFADFTKSMNTKHRKVTPLWPEANGQVEQFMRNIGKNARIAHASGLDWRREIYAFLMNYRDTPHPSTKKTPYELSMGRKICTKIPKMIEKTPNDSIATEDANAKYKMKMYAERRRNVQPRDIQGGDTVLVKQRKQNKLSTPYDPVPHTVETTKGSMITARRTSDGHCITRNSSHLKKLQVPAENIPVFVPNHNPEDYDSYEDLPDPIDGEPDESAVNDTTIRPESPLKNCVSTRSGRVIKRPAWMADYE